VVSGDIKVAFHVERGEVSTWDRKEKSDTALELLLHS
jgi:hypothetical protein